MSPLIFNLRTDPYENATIITSKSYWEWYIERVWVFAPQTDVVGELMATFKEFSLRQKAASVTVNDAPETLETALGGK